MILLHQNYQNPQLYGGYKLASSVFQNKIGSLRVLRDHILVRDMNFEERTLSSGIIVRTDNGKTEGIRPRWARVYRVGKEQKEVKEGQWVYVEHGRWTRGVDLEIDGETFTIRRVDNESILLVSDEQPADDIVQNGI